MARRANGEGSIYKRADGRWCATVSVDGGKRKSFYGKRREDVAHKLAAALKVRQDGLPLPLERLRLGTYLTQWLETMKPRLRPEAYRRYEEMVRIHIKPEIGSNLLARITPQQVQTAYARRLESGLSPTTVQLLHGVLHKALDQALRWGVVGRNVTDLVEAPRRPTAEARALSAAEAGQLLRAARGDRLEALYVFAITCGVRLGEIQALRWRDVDLPGARIRIMATLQGTAGGAPVFAEPKSAKSRREVHLPAVVVKALQKHRLAQLEERLQARTEWVDYDLVFTNERGRPLDGNNFRQRSFSRLLEKAGLPRMRFHDLRHTAATLLMTQGVPIKVASEMLGHADIGITLRTYSHVLPGMQQQATEAMDRLFGQVG